MQLGMLNGGVHLFGNGGMTSSVHSDADIAATVDAFGATVEALAAEGAY